jgi:iron complex outermembrane receptor protein
MPAEGIKNQLISSVKDPLFRKLIFLTMRHKIVILLTMISLGTLSAFTLNGQRSVLHGRVTDEAGIPLPGASLTIEGTYLGTYSGSDGGYSFNDLRTGSYKLLCTFVGYRMQSAEVVLESDTELNFVLPAADVLTGEVIISATRAGRNTPLAYVTVGNEVIRKNNTGQDLPYLLSLTPSLVETSEAGNGIGYTNLRIRGTDASRINVTIDGIPLNDPESQQVFWVDLPDLASSVESIQVQRGVGTSSNGAAAFGATINIQTKNPENEPFAGVNMSAGSFNTFRNVVEAGTGLLADRFALQLRLSDIRSNGYIARTGSDHRSAFISGVYRDERSRLKANIILGEEHTGIGWWGVPKEMLGIDRRYNPAGEYTDENGEKQYYDNESDNYIQNHTQLIYGLKINSNLNLNAALHYTKGKGYYEEYKENARFDNYGLPVILLGETTISRSDLIRRKWMSNDFYGLVCSIKYTGKRIDATAGGGVNNYSGDHFGNIIWMRNAGALEKDHRWYLNTGSKREISLYTKADFMLTGKLSVFGDLQYRSILYNMSGSDDDLKDLAQQHNFGFFNPKAGVFWSFAPGQETFLSFSVAGREPARSDFKEAAGDPGATPRPETLYDTEAGYSLRKEKYSLSLNFYGMIYQDQLVPTGELSNVGYPILTNVPESYRTGIEISTGLKPAGFIDWNLGATLSRNKIKGFTEYYIDYNTSDWSEHYKSKPLGRVDIAYSPSVTGTSEVTVRLLRKLELRLITKYVGEQYFDNTMSRDRVIDPYLVTNLRLDFEPEIRRIRNTRIQFLINNLFNAEYESNAYGGNWYEDGVERTWSYFFPQAGTNFMLRVGLTF